MLHLNLSTKVKVNNLTELIGQRKDVFLVGTCVIHITPPRAKGVAYFPFKCDPYAEWILATRDVSNYVNSATPT